MRVTALNCSNAFGAYDGCRLDAVRGSRVRLSTRGAADVWHTYVPHELSAKSWRGRLASYLDAEEKDISLAPRQCHRKIGAGGTGLLQSLF